MDKDELKQKLMEYFSIDNDCYAYNLTRVKEARQYGTLDIDDFEEFTEETIDDIVEFVFSKKCAYCGKIIKRGNNYKFCSDECFKAYRKEYNKKLHKEHPERYRQSYKKWYEKNKKI